MDFSTQSKVTWEDSKNGDSDDGDDAGEESVWTNTAGTANTGVWKDTRTELYWSNVVSPLNDNNFTVATCAFFTSPRGDTVVTSNCGNSIIQCHNLSLDATGDGVPETDWYLPSQKESLQAYLDGIYNQTNATFAGANTIWTSTQSNGVAGSAWIVDMTDGETGIASKGSGFSVHCVRRD